MDDLSGVVEVLKPFDFEKLPSSPDSPLANVKHLNLSIRAHDSGIPSRYSITLLTLFIFDTNDNAPIFRESEVSRIIREDFVPGSQIGRVEATDFDGSSPFNRVFYRIESGAQDKFLIESETGLVRLAPGAQLDYNIKPVHILEIIGIDGGGKSSLEPCIFNISLKDINNKKPRFEFNTAEQDSSSGKVYVAQVPENAANGHFILKVNASDPDSTAVLRFSLDFNKSDARNEDGRVVLTNTGSKGQKSSKLRGIDLSKLFILDPIDGVLRLGGSMDARLDREIMETVRLTVIVRDIASETGEQKVSASIQITIIE